MYCVSCKSSTPLRDARYCAQCGAPLQKPLWSETSASRSERGGASDPGGILRACPRCRKNNPVDSAYCAYCGYDMAGPKPEEAPDLTAVSRAQELLDAAAQSYAKGARERAREQCQEALTLDPRNAKGYALLSEILRAQGSLGDALQAMTIAVRLDSHNAEFERRLRDLREEQDRAVAPMLQTLREPRFRPRRSAPSLPRAADILPRMPQRNWRVPEWVNAAALIGLAMLLMALLPGLMGHLQSLLHLVIGALVTLFVYRDARANGMAPYVCLAWAAAIFVGTFFMGWAGLLLFLVYLISTRGRR